MKWLIVLAGIVLSAATAKSGVGADRNGSGQSRYLTLENAASIALKQNPEILKALHEIERTRGLVIEIRAQALPHLVSTGTYNQQDPGLLQGVGSSLSSQSSAGSFSIQDKSWRITIEARQLIYSGGQVKAAVKIAKLTEDASYYVLRETVTQVIANVRTQFSTVLLDRDLITVSEESIQLLSDQLMDQQNRFSAGTVPRFNVLQAEVALANARPDLIRARNNHLIARLQLAKTLGFNASQEVNVIGELRASPGELSLSRALATAKQRRAILKAQKNTIATEEQQITVAAAGYKPQLSADAGYEVTSSQTTSDLSRSLNGWYFGVTGTWNIFDGFQSKGRVDQAKARLASANVSFADSVQQVELEVQKAFAAVNQARELIASQTKVVEQADEALRLAKERLAAGAGTQLDVLSAQVARTQARTTQKQALSDYNVAIAEFDRATGAETIYDNTVAEPGGLRPSSSHRGARAPLITRD